MTTRFATEAACGSTKENIQTFEELWAARNKKTRKIARARAARLCASCPLARPQEGTQPCQESLLE